MRIKVVEGQKAIGRVGEKKARPPGANFSQVLHRSLADAGYVARRGPALNSKVRHALAPEANGEGKVILGSINNTHPTVSELIQQHPQFGRDCWKIIFSEQNRHKSYRKIQPGTTVYLDPNTLEISWTRQQVRGASNSSLNVAGGKDTPQTSPVGAPVALGTISGENSSVTDLLVRHPQYGKDCWKILSAPQNRDKHYTKIRSGTEVYLDPDTLTIHWQEAGEPVKENHPNSGCEQTGKAEEGLPAGESFAVRLVQAVKSYLGTPYAEMDCYTLLVQGLEAMGVHYQGPGGLRELLVQRAETKGIPKNSYFTGDGLIEASGTHVYVRKIPRVIDPEVQARQVMQEMAPLLKKGHILSFSTPTRGHTGIVSQLNGDWTYINSGRLDHQVNGAGITKGVGEEVLQAEIVNWFKMAEHRREPLLVTMGHLSADMLPVTASASPGTSAS